MISMAPRPARRDPDSVFGGWKGPHPADARGPRLGTPRGCRQPSASSVFSVVQSGVTWGVTTEAAEDTEGLRVMSMAQRLARWDQQLFLWGWKGPPSCRCPGVWDRARSEGITAENTEVTEGLRVISMTPRFARRDPELFLWGVAGPLSCRCPGVGDRVGREEITAENTEVTEGLRVISMTPRFARRDWDFVVGGGGAPILPMPANPRRGACRGCRQPSASSVFSVVESGRRGGRRDLEFFCGGWRGPHPADARAHRIG